MNQKTSFMNSPFAPVKCIKLKHFFRKHYNKRINIKFASSIKKPKCH